MGRVVSQKLYSVYTQNANTTRNYPTSNSNDTDLQKKKKKNLTHFDLKRHLFLPRR